MEAWNDLCLMTDEALRTFSQLSPLEVLLGLAIVAGLVNAVTRSRESLLVMGTALVYSLPFLLARTGLL